MSATDPPPMVCFDLGGVLVRICRSWEEGLAAAGLPRRDHAHLDPQRRRSVVEQYTRGLIAPAEFYDRLSEAVDGLYTPAELARLHEAWVIEEQPGASDLVERLNAQGVTTACLSNTNHDHWVRMLDWPSLRALRHQHASHLLGAAKPEETCYRAFERRVGCAGEEIVFFDDLEENVTTARRLGWRAHRIDDSDSSVAQMERILRTLGLLPGC